MIPASSVTEPAIASPCVRICMMHGSGFCKGCARTLGEIASWTSLSSLARVAIIEKLPARKAALAGDSPL